MSKFDKKAAPVRAGVVKATSSRTTTTHEGAPAFGLEPKGELYSLAVTSMVGEDTFYEAASDRDARFVELVHKVASEDPEWIARFIPFVRDEMHLRSASIVLAAELVAATGGGEGYAEVVASACQRADEPAEILSYWHTRYGRSEPRAIKRGVAMAIARLTNEYTAIKYDGGSRNWRLGDVIERVHPVPTDETQAELFKFLLDRRHHGDTQKTDLDKLPKIKALLEWEAAGHPLESLPEIITWERLSSYRAMDKDAWETVIPSMGYMALLRNLRNFDKVEVSDEVAAQVIERIADPEAVAKSRQLPIRFFTAYANVPSERWSAALEKALNLSLKNVPEFPGRTLVLVDVSASMSSFGYSSRSEITPAKMAALFGSAVAKRSSGADLVVFGTTSDNVTSLLAKNSLLKMTGALEDMGRTVGHGTEMASALQQNFDGHDRVLLFSDMQAFADPAWGASLTDDLVTRLGVRRLYAWDLNSYGRTPFNAGDGRSYQFAGLTDQAFKMVKLLEAGGTDRWPF